MSLLEVDLIFSTRISIFVLKTFFTRGKVSSRMKKYCLYGGSKAERRSFEGGHIFLKAKISKCPAHGLKPKVRIELNRTFVRFKEFKAHVRLSSVAHYSEGESKLYSLYSQQPDE